MLVIRERQIKSMPRFYLTPAPADTRHGSRGENKAKTGSKEKDNDHRADIPFEIKRGV